MAVKISTVLKKSISAISYGTTICCAAGAAYIGYHSLGYKAQLYMENKNLLDPKDGIYSALFSEYNGKSKAYIMKKFGRKLRESGLEDNTMLEGGTYEYFHAGKSVNINTLMFRFRGDVLADMSVVVFRFDEDDKTSIENLNARILKNKEYGFYEYEDPSDDEYGGIHQKITVKRNQHWKVMTDFTAEKKGLLTPCMNITYYYSSDGRKLYDDFKKDYFYDIKNYIHEKYEQNVRRHSTRKRKDNTPVLGLLKKKKDCAVQEQKKKPDVKNLDCCEKFQIVNYYHNKELFDCVGNLNPDYDLVDNAIAEKYHEGKKIYRYLYGKVEAELPRDNFDYNVTVDGNIIGMITDDSDDLDDIIHPFPEHVFYVSVEGGEYKYYDSLEKKIITGSDILKATLLVMYNKDETSE